MKFDISKIVEGWRNHLLPPDAIKDLIEETSQERLAICLNCPFNSTPGEVKNSSKCTACGCWLIPKSKCLSCNCGLEEYNKCNPPIPLHWTAVATEAEDIEIEKIIEDDK